MAIHISRLDIDSYRGISQLCVENLGGVNVFLGDNNAGKTSALEVIELLCMPNEYGMVQVARQRENARSVLRSRLGIMDSVLFLFDISSKEKAANRYSLRIGGTINGQHGFVKVSAEVVQKLIDWNNISELDKRILKEQGVNIEEELPSMIGVIESSFEPNEQMSMFVTEKSRPFELDNYSRNYHLNKEGSIIDVQMVQTIDHLVGDGLNRLLKKKKNKDRAVELLKDFDDSICDIRYINEEIGPRFYPVIENDNHDYIPLSLYGDGMKKVLTMLNALVGTENGVVLIDEFETALHTSAMKKVFRFMLDIAKELNIQLFLTTHSEEAIDKLLECAEADLQDIRIIRLKKKNGRTFARVTEGEEALHDRKEYNMEYRV